MSNSGEFIRLFNELAALVYAINKANGWYDKGEPTPDTLIANLHGEVSEMWEAIRKHNPPSEHIPEFTAIEEEMADVVIRSMDTAHVKGYRLAEAIVAKLQYNTGRGYRHGGKLY